ncbi:Rieske (2Fe-2S) protein [Stackebrandtia soli]|uniref:Rieske (2Fe-2S) protein n=1 Tax=Stackebrandtia soli TaxID=1892856 RepID=UPI0039EBB049
MTPPSGVTRRGALCAAFGASASMLLGACGGGDDGGDAGPTASRNPDVAIAAVEEIDIGGGIVTDDLVVVRPDAETVRAFLRACPHQGNNVDPPADGTIICPAHGSRFNSADGALLSGPATTGLTKVQVRVEDGEVFPAK